jgi:hypothetical protein
LIDQLTDGRSHHDRLRVALSKGGQ